MSSRRATRGRSRSRKQSEEPALNSDSIAKRAMMAAQMAVAIRTDAKKILKAERRADVPPVYYLYNFVAMISQTTTMAGQAAAASLAALELAGVGGADTLLTADALAKSAAFQTMSARSLYDAIVLSLEARDATI